MSFLQYFNDHVRHVYLVDKKTSKLMRVVNWGLSITNFLGLSSIQDFLDGYVTTLRNTIYASPQWKFDDPTTPVRLHELTHVMQWSFRYVMRYLFSPRWRCIYESEAHQTVMMCFPDRKTEAFAMAAAGHLVPYGIKLREASTIMSQRLVEAVNNAPQPIPFAIYKQYMAWYSNEMKKPSQV